MSLDTLRSAGFDVETTNHAGAILSRDFKDDFKALSDIIAGTTIECTELLESGGNEAAPTRRLRGRLYEAGWSKRVVKITKAVDGVEKSSTTHEIDHVRDCERGTLALEIEWNNKDPFFDRDLENFQRLHTDGAISVGLVVTRGSSLQANIRSLVRACAYANQLESIQDFERLRIKEPTANQRTRLYAEVDSDFAERASIVLSTKYGESTTHWNKLMERLARGVGNPCPLLLLGLPDSCVKIIRRRKH